MSRFNLAMAALTALVSARGDVRLEARRDLNHEGRREVMRVVSRDEVRRGEVRANHDAAGRDARRV